VNANTEQIAWSWVGESDHFTRVALWREDWSPINQVAHDVDAALRRRQVASGVFPELGTIEATDTLFYGDRDDFALDEEG
jgi:hypothetical protein